MVKPGWWELGLMGVLGMESPTDQERLDECRAQVAQLKAYGGSENAVEIAQQQKKAPKPVKKRSLKAKGPTIVAVDQDPFQPRPVLQSRAPKNQNTPSASKVNKQPEATPRKRAKAAASPRTRVPAGTAVAAKTARKSPPRNKGVATQKRVSAHTRPTRGQSVKSTEGKTKKAGADGAVAKKGSDGKTVAKGGKKVVTIESPQPEPPLDFFAALCSMLTGSEPAQPEPASPKKKTKKTLKKKKSKKVAKLPRVAKVKESDAKPRVQSGPPGDNARGEQLTLPRDYKQQTFGFSLMSSEGVPLARVASVTPGSYAQMQGLRIQSVVTEINGHRVLGLPLPEIDALIAETKGQRLRARFVSLVGAKRLLSTEAPVVEEQRSKRAALAALRRLQQAVTVPDAVQPKADPVAKDEASESLDSQGCADK